jgi:dihydrofolate synthase/folylpolyglutamate synthase
MIAGSPDVHGRKNLNRTPASSKSVSTGYLELLHDLEVFGIKLGLEGPRRLLAALGSPESGLPVVLVAGSNGKGSTSAFLAAMAGAAGYRTGLYTSPHLETVEERLRLDGRAIAPERLGGLLERVIAAAGGERPTYFEALTVAAFLWYAEERVDLAVVEVGMGGRLDATNTASPLLSLITPISLDHQQHLGETLALIAREKAGILRAGRPAIAWIEDGEPAAAVAQAAAELGADLAWGMERARIEAVAARGWDGQTVELATGARRYRLAPSLLGAHQAKNLALAVLAAERLAVQGFPRLDAAAIARGVAACRWPGRLETVALSGGRRALLDAAHHEGGAQALADFLAGPGASVAGGPVDLLVGLLADKDAAAILGRIVPMIGREGRAILTTPDSPRARPPAELAAYLPAEVPALVEPDRAAALDLALAGGRSTLVACGSIFLIGEVRRLLRERFGVPEPAAAVATG